MGVVSRIQRVGTAGDDDDDSDNDDDDDGDVCLVQLGAKGSKRELVFCAW